MRLHFVVADRPGVPSGGSIYDQRVLAELRAAGHDIREHALVGSWPHPSGADRTALSRALEDAAADAGSRPVVLVDGLIACAASDQVRAAEAAGTRIVVLVHLPLPAEGGLDASTQAALERQERRALSTASRVIATSRWARSDLARRYGLTRVGCAAPGTDRQPVAAGSSPPHLLMVASLTERKNHPAVLQALAALADRPWRATFVGPGSGSWAAGIRRRIATHPAGHRLTCAGALTGADLDAAYTSADLLLLPSHAETFGMVVTEALARGIPAVVGRGTGAVEALLGSDPPGPPPPGVPGAVVDPGDPGALAAVLTGWLDDPAVRRRWRAEALTRRDRLRPWASTATDVLRELRGLREPPP